MEEMTSEQQPTNDDSAVLFTSDESPLVDLLSDAPPELQNATLKSVMLATSPLAMPLVQPPLSSAEAGGDSTPASLDTGVLEVFGSWSKVAPRLEGLELMDVERQLEDAINERDTPTAAAAVATTTTTVVTSGLVAKTGFTPPEDRQT